MMKKVQYKRVNDVVKKLNGEGIVAEGFITAFPNIIRWRFYLKNIEYAILFDRLDGTYRFCRIESDVIILGKFNNFTKLKKCLLVI